MVILGDMKDISGKRSPRRRTIPWLFAGGAILLATIGFVLTLLNRSYVNSWEGVVVLVGVLGYALPGALIVTRANRARAIGWLFLLFAALIALLTSAGHYAIYGLQTAQRPLSGVMFAALLQTWLGMPSFAIVGLFLMLYPNGRLPSRRWRPVAALLVICWGVASFAQLFESSSLTYFPILGGPPIVLSALNPLPHLISIPTETVRSANGLLWSFGIVFLLLALLTPAIRYRRTDLVSRKQLRWLMLCALITGVVVFLAALSATVFGTEVTEVDMALIFTPIFLVGFPIAVGIAILRHNLYDLDLIINRALVYGALTVALGLVYSVGVIVLQRLLPVRSELAVVLSTLAVAALFQPLRRRIQSGIDRRFYRQKYNAARTLARFALVARDEVDLDRLLVALNDTVNETVQPEHLSLWLAAEDPGMNSSG